MTRPTTPALLTLHQLPMPMPPSLPELPVLLVLLLLLPVQELVVRSICDLSSFAPLSLRLPRVSGAAVIAGRDDRAAVLPLGVAVLPQAVAVRGG